MDQLIHQTPCHCGSEILFEECCQPYLKGRRPDTAEKLMRSRFSAYVLTDIDYLQKTHDRSTMGNFDFIGTKEWAEQTRWSHLEILGTEKGLDEDDTGVVEFKAHFKTKDGEDFHHEVSQFTKKNGTWYFSKGKSPNIKQIRHEAKPIGRNDPCSCGSGKKFKKCCLNS